MMCGATLHFGFACLGFPELPQSIEQSANQITLKWSNHVSEFCKHCVALYTNHIY